ncbi:hypothetical protein ACFXK0_12895 [Nocardia sp. NPDC059177]|uniref:hypothetical protein n=1 Tax=Nocardia sp. NPDC059177 TaxID=3346759 RepID=UPI0036A8E252
MARSTDIIDYDGGAFYLLDNQLSDQTDTITAIAGGRLRPGTGALAIKTSEDRSRGNLGRVSVEVGDGQFPPEPTDAEFIDEISYSTELGSQRIGDCYFAECRGELNGTLTPPGPARIHVRLYQVPGPHEPFHASAPGYESRMVPVNEHLLLHLWSEPSA